MVRGWLADHWEQLRGTLTPLELVLVVQSWWWGAWLLIAMPPLEEVYPEMFGWTLWLGGSGAVGAMSCVLGGALVVASRRQRWGGAKVGVLCVLCAWWSGVALAFAEVDWSLTSTPSYGTFAIVAILSLIAHPPPEWGGADVG